MERTSFSLLSEETDFIPLITNEEDNSIPDSDLQEEISILPLRNTVLFPGVVIPITASRDKSIKLINDANKGNKLIGVVSQIDKNIEDPTIKDVYKTGTVAKILKVLKMPDGNTTVIIQGKKRFVVEKVISDNPYLKAIIQGVPEIIPDNTDKKFIDIK